MDDFSKLEIDKIVCDILVGSKSIDVFPTPVQDIVLYSNLKMDDTVDLVNPDASFLNGLAPEFVSSFSETLSSVRGFIDRDTKTIYIDKSQGKPRQNFVKLHEVGHDVLPWQREISKHLDDDSSLSLDVLDSFEAEANYFASAILFQQSRFQERVDKMPLALSASRDLSKLFGASFHATLRRYIECSRNRCALVVLENCSARGEKPICYKRDFFQSKSWFETFGNVILPDSFGYKWEFSKDYYFKKRYHENGEISLSTENGEADFHYHFFNNTFNAFVFLFPYGERNHNVN